MFSGVSPCLTFQCIEKEDGQIETRGKLQVCDERCAQGWEYQAPLNDSGICCGECKQVACVDSKGIEHEPDSKWKSDDFCTNYMCISQNETVNRSILQLSINIFHPFCCFRGVLRSIKKILILLIRHLFFRDLFFII